MVYDPARRAELAQMGVEHCRLEQWQEGLECLTRAFLDGEPRGSGAGVALSYYGYGIAKEEGRVPRGLELCERAVKVECYQPEVYLNLARIQLLMKDRSKAVQTLERGLGFDSGHAGLQAMRRQLGMRSRPVLPFLGRSNPVNRALGRLRARLKQR